MDLIPIKRDPKQEAGSNPQLFLSFVPKVECKLLDDVKSQRNLFHL